MAFQFMPNLVMDIAKNVMSQKTATENDQSTVKSYVPMVQSAWIGGDEEAFSNEVLTRLVPKYFELALAFAGIELNLTKSSDSVQSADQKAAKAANGLGDLFSKIF